MSNDDSWEELAWQFEDLDPDCALALIWNYDRSKKRYTFGHAWSAALGFSVRPHSNIESHHALLAAKFTAYGTRAGRKLGIPGNPLYWWLVEIKLRGQNDLPGEDIELDPVTGSEKRVIQGRVNDVCKMAAALCYSLEANPRPYVGILQAESIGPSEISVAAPKERKSLRDAYLVRFPNVLILDICWAAAQHYSEWKRWLRGSQILKDGSAPDTAFRQLLTSGKSPSEYRKQSRPKGWN